MPKVICTIENASENISGVKFVSHAQGMISEEISQEQHDYFMSVPGFAKVSPKGLAVPTKTIVAEPSEEENEIARLRARCDELGIEWKGTMKAPRLAADIAAAEEVLIEQAAADAKAALDAK